MTNIRSDAASNGESRFLLFEPCPLPKEGIPESPNDSTAGGAYIALSAVYANRWCYNNLKA